MLATTGELPAEDDAYAYEVKWDGVRALAHGTPNGLQLRTRNLSDVTAQYPELRGLGDALPEGTVLDGEIVALDERGLPSFERLQRRMHVADQARVLDRMAATPVTYMLFDLLVHNGQPIMHLPYPERRQLLEELDLEAPAWRLTPSQVGGGADLLEAARRLGLEGIVAKRLGSPYRPGKRSRDWIKVKIRHRQELVVAGWTPGEGARAGEIGALLMGYHDEQGRLAYAGKVGTGYTDEDLRRLDRRLEPLRTPENPFDVGAPPPNARFVEPRLVAEVEFHEWTRGGQLRHPSFKGLRDDKDPAEVVREVTP